MKTINTLSEDEAKQLLDYAIPDNEGFREISLTPKISEHGTQITLEGRHIIGIVYCCGINMDTCILHFDNQKAMYWLYCNGYDISDFLYGTCNIPQLDTDIDNALGELYRFSFQHDFNRTVKQKDINKIIDDEYYNKEYTLPEKLHDQ